MPTIKVAFSIPFLVGRRSESFFKNGVLGYSYYDYHKFIVKSCFRSKVLKSNLAGLSVQETDQMEMLKGCVDAWESLGLADSPNAEQIKKVECAKYLKGYKKGFADPNFNDSATLEFTGRVSYKGSLSAVANKKGCINVTKSNRFDLGYSLGVKHNVKACQKKQNFYSKKFLKTFLFICCSCVLLAIVVCVIF